MRSCKTLKPRAFNCGVRAIRRYNLAQVPSCQKTILEHVPPFANRPRSELFLRDLQRFQQRLVSDLVVMRQQQHRCAHRAQELIILIRKGQK